MYPNLPSPLADGSVLHFWAAPQFTYAVVDAPANKMWRGRQYNLPFLGWAQVAHPDGPAWRLDVEPVLLVNTVAVPGSRLHAVLGLRADEPVVIQEFVAPQQQNLQR